MKKITPFKNPVHRNKMLNLIFTLLSCLFCYLNGNAHEYNCIASSITDTVAEKKVDYLEKIYFSGGNKEGLNTDILVTLQEIEGKQPTPALAKQVTFLLEIKDQATAADNACDILDLLAVGIYNIDAAEAKQQGVRMPSDKAKAKAGDALTSLNKLSSSADRLSTTSSNLAWSNYLLTGRTKGFGTAGKLGAASNMLRGAGALGQTGKDLGDLGKTIFKKKDKACNEVARKEIQLGEHAANTQANVASNVNMSDASAQPPTAGKITVISISGVDYTKLSRIHERIKNCATVSEAKMKYDVNGSSINVSHSGSVEDFLTVVLSACKDIFSSKNVTGMNPEERKINLKL